MESEYNTILLVNMEESDFLSKFSDVFEEKGFSIYHAEDVEHAYQILGSQSVQVIILDMDDNYEESFKFCHQIKKNKNLAKIFIIGLSGAHEKYGIYIDASTREELKWLNCDLFVHKPLNAKNLYLLLKKEFAILRKLDGTALDSPDEEWL